MPSRAVRPVPGSPVGTYDHGLTERPGARLACERGIPAAPPRASPGDERSGRLSRRSGASRVTQGVPGLRWSRPGYSATPWQRGSPARCPQKRVPQRVQRRDLARVARPGGQRRHVQGAGSASLRCQAGRCTAYGQRTAWPPARSASADYRRRGPLSSLDEPDRDRGRNARAAGVRSVRPGGPGAPREMPRHPPARPALTATWR